MSEWQPIATAPHDGTPIDLWHRDGFRITETWWDDTDKCWTCLFDNKDFTHWMHAPEPPK